jgi:hypothetical protein
MPVTLCLMLSVGEPRESVKYPLTEREIVVALPARHTIDRVEPDADLLCVWIDVPTEPARPVDVRFQVLAPGCDPPSRSRFLGRGVWRGEQADVYGTYLGVVSDEN